MSNTPKLEGINSVCTTSEELIKSEDFMSGIAIILEKVKSFNKDYILSLFTKLQSGEDLGDEGREDLNSFVSDSKVARLGQELLSKLSNVSVNVNTNNIADLENFFILSNNIFAEDGFKKVQSYVRKVAKITDLTLDKYTGMKLLKIEVNGEEKEVWMDEANLRVDSSEWKETEIDGTTVKINTEGDITEYSEGALAGEQLFTWRAAMREAKKQGKRLPNDNDEFQAIIDKVGVNEFMKLFPGYRYTNGISFCVRGDKTFFWSGGPSGGDTADCMEFERSDSTSYHHWSGKTFGLSVRCIMDNL